MLRELVALDLDETEADARIGGVGVERESTIEDIT
jgi:hypothetical protein